jgi:hypothetical protein
VKEGLWAYVERSSERGIKRSILIVYRSPVKSLDVPGFTRRI